MELELEIELERGFGLEVQMQLVDELDELAVVQIIVTVLGLGLKPEETRWG